MYVSVCIAGLGIVIITSWYSFMWQLAQRSENKRRLEKELAEKNLPQEQLIGGNTDDAA